MYSGWSPFLRVKFWKKEFVGSGVERSAGEKKSEGSGRIVDWIRGKRNGLRGWITGGGGSDMIRISGGGGGGGGGGGLRRFLVINLLTFRSTFLNMARQSMT